MTLDLPLTVKNANPTKGAKFKKYVIIPTANNPSAKNTAIVKNVVSELDL